MSKKLTGMTLATALAFSIMYAGNAEITGSGFRDSACSGVLQINLWLDSDGDGMQGRMEQVFAGAELVMTMIDFQHLGPEKFTSNSDGHIRVDSLCRGDYTLEIDPLTIPGTAEFDAAFEAGAIVIDADINADIVISLSESSDKLSPGSRYIDLAFAPVTRGLK